MLQSDTALVHSGAGNKSSPQVLSVPYVPVDHPSLHVNQGSSIDSQMQQFIAVPTNQLNVPTSSNVIGQKFGFSFGQQTMLVDQNQLNTLSEIIAVSSTGEISTKTITGPVNSVSHLPSQSVNFQHSPSMVFSSGVHQQIVTLLPVPNDHTVINSSTSLPLVSASTIESSGSISNSGKHLIL